MTGKGPTCPACGHPIAYHDASGCHSALPQPGGCTCTASHAQMTLPAVAAVCVDCEHSWPVHDPKGCTAHTSKLPCTCNATRDPITHAITRHTGASPMPTKTTAKKKPAPKSVTLKKAAPKPAAKPAPKATPAAKSSSGGTLRDGSARSDAIPGAKGQSDLLFVRVSPDVLEQLDALSREIALGSAPNRSQAIRYAIHLGLKAAKTANRR